MKDFRSKITRLTLFACTGAAILTATSCGSKADRLVLSDEQDTLSWAVGASLSQTVKSGIYTFDNDKVYEAFENALADKESRLDAKTYNAACQYIQFLTQMSQSGRRVSTDANAPQDTLSWAMGKWLAQTVKSGFYEFDNEIVSLAMKSMLNGGKNKLDEVSYDAACRKIAELAINNQQKINETAENQASKSEKEYLDKLLAENKNIQKHPSGFYYEVLREGTGPKATPGLRIKFDFRGSNMITDEVYVQTYGEGEPTIHVLGSSMFRGIFEGLQLMNAGSKYRFYFPHDLVRGANGLPDYTPVTYLVELHEIYQD